MKIQSLSVVVPNTKCINACKFCVACMKHDEKDYEDTMDPKNAFFDLFLIDYLKRLEFCRDNGCNTVMLTGNSEPQQNREFLALFGIYMQLLKQPFRCIEMQTTGVLLDRNYMRFLRNHVGVNTISLSVSSFDDEENRSIIGVAPKIELKLLELCKMIREYTFNLRMSINLNSTYDKYSAKEIFELVHDKYGANQVTFRVMYTSPDNTPQDKWIFENHVRESLVKEVSDYIHKNGTYLGRLEFGQEKWSVNGLTTVLDGDSMASAAKEAAKNNLLQVDANQILLEDPVKYLILRPDCKLYSSWEDPASLIF